MLLSIQSTEDKNLNDSCKTYSRIRTNINIPWECKYVKYHVSSLNTKANILITTNDDRIIVTYKENETDEDEKCLNVDFENSYYLNTNDIITKLGNLNEVLSVNIEDRHMTFTPTKDIKFITLTHRARLVCGLINVKLNEVYKAGTKYVFDIPILDYANKLYLVSKQSQSIHSNIGDKEYTPSVIGNVDYIIKDDTFIIVNFETYGRPIENVVNVDSFGMIELELVDFMYEPIILCSPMFVTIRVEPYRTPSIDYVHM